jgi:hypothetical protein
VEQCLEMYEQKCDQETYELEMYELEKFKLEMHELEMYDLEKLIGGEFLPGAVP